MKMQLSAATQSLQITPLQRGNAYVGKNATVMGDATVQDDAIVCGGLLTGKAVSAGMP